MRLGYLSSIFHIVLLAGPGPDAAGGGGAALLGAAEHDGVLVEVARSLHRHRHRAGFLAHIVAVEPSEEEGGYFTPGTTSGKQTIAIVRTFCAQS